MITSSELREKYLKYFELKGHKVISSASLIPENDASTLFVSAGMQPLVPYLLGETHPSGTRLVGCQKCVRTDDIDEVGDAYHHTFFEMLGNWSLGDYFKKESIPWSYEFLTTELGISPDKLSVSVFAGDDDAPRDTEAAEIWKSVGIPDERIYYFGKEDNWWAAGPTGPCGPDTEIFYDVTGVPCTPDCKPGDICGRYFEIWNNVFMVYNRLDDGTLEELPNKNVDTGMGLERTIAVLNGLDDNYKSDLFWPIILKIKELTGENYEDNRKSIRIIADHIRASVFLIADGIVPSNKLQGYVLRRLLRRAATRAFLLNKDFNSKDFNTLSKIIFENYSFYLKNANKEVIENEISTEIRKFRSTLEKGLKEVQKIENIDGKIAFDLYQSYGFPLELTEELFLEKGQQVDKEKFAEEFEIHRELSRTASAGMFKGGLAGDTPTMRKYHTTAHLLQAALRKVLGEHVEQKGQNITDERLRFDFKHSSPVTDMEKDKVEQIINEAIDKALPMYSKVVDLEEAYEDGALGFFRDKYGDQVSVYTIGSPSTGSGQFSDENWVSKEICGGPHVGNTSEIGHVTINKEESAGAGIRRIYATISDK